MAGSQLSHRNEGRATVGPARTRIPEGLISVATAAVALLCYHATLLPGLDLGDSASFQTGVGSLTLTPRQAYPLYYALGNLFVWFHPGEPARAMNMASAVYGAVAVGLITLLGCTVSRSRTAGAATGLLLAFSYTFWTQAITAEVYTLHLVFVGASFLALMAWAEKPSAGSLALFYAIFATGFGNHLSMSLLLPAFTVFLLVNRRSGEGDPLRGTLLALAVGIAAAGALQYAWNFCGLWSAIEPPASLSEGLAQFWVDVTKADWRETLVMNVSETGLKSRPAMYWFDVRQQVGVGGVVLGLIGLAHLLIASPSRAVCLLIAYLTNLLFAWTYNVGDAYVFFLPSHYVLAIFAGAGVGAIVGLAGRLSTHAAAAAGLLCLAYPVWRGYDAWPAVDRSWDTRAERLLDRFTQPTAGVTSAAVYGVNTNWQVQNAFEYFMRTRKPGVPWFTTEDLEWFQRGDRTAQFQRFVESNRDIERHLIVTPEIYKTIQPLSSARVELEVSSQSLQTHIASLGAGTPYALGILRADREFPIDRPALESLWRSLTGGAHSLPDLRQYVIVVGRSGEPPLLIRSEDRPYRVRTAIGSLEFDIRMESWLPTDTIRRAGFGHVIVARRHVLSLERGVSFTALGPEAEPVYAFGLLAPIPRYILGMQP